MRNKKINHLLTSIGHNIQFHIINIRYPSKWLFRRIYNYNVPFLLNWNLHISFAFFFDSQNYMILFDRKIHIKIVMYCFKYHKWTHLVYIFFGDIKIIINWLIVGLWSILYYHVNDAIPKQNSSPHTPFVLLMRQA